jgi:hypothetical protein
MNPLVRLKTSNFSISCRVWASLLFEIAKSAIRQPVPSESYSGRDAPEGDSALLKRDRRGNNPELCVGKIVPSLRDYQVSFDERFR